MLMCVYQIAQIFCMSSFIVLFFLQSAKNPANARRVIIVLLNGQKLEVMCDPSTTGKQLFQTIISHMALHEIQSYFGLTYIYGNKLILSFKNIFSYISHCLFLRHAQNKESSKWYCQLPLPKCDENCLHFPVSHGTAEVWMTKKWQNH